MGSKGDCFDNAVAESFIATLKKELVHRQTWPTRRELTGEVFEYIEGFRKEHHGNPQGQDSRHHALEVPV